MPRAANFHYQDPTAAIGSNLVRAIFGDPQAAAQQAQERAKADALAAQAEENRTHARVYGSQATGLDTANTAQSSLPDLIARLQAPAQQVPSIDDPAFLDGVGTQPPVPTAGEQFQGNLGPLVAAMAQMNGDKVDPRQVVGTLASFFGGDEMARRGLVAQGQSPSAAFAITPDRADDIAGQGYDAKQSLAESVAGINNRDDVPVANIQAGARRYASDQSAGASNFATSTRSDTSRYATDARAAAARDAAERKEAERAAARRSKPISVSSFKKLDKVVADQLDGRGLQSPPLEDGTPGASRLDPGVNTWIRTRAIESFRQSGNFLNAATQAVEAAVKASKRQKAARSGKPAVGTTIAKERAAAMDAIAKGAPRAAVSRLFQELTGQAL